MNDGIENRSDAAGSWRVGRIAAQLPSWLAAVTLFVLMIMTFVDVVLRSAFNNPLSSGSELTVIFMAIIVFSSLPLVTWRGEGITVDLFDSWFSPGAARIRDFLVDMLSGILLFWPAMRIWDYMQRAWNYGDVTEYLKIPQAYVISFIALSVSVTACVLIIRAIVGLVRPRLLKHNS